MHPVAARAMLQACDDARIEGLDDAAKFALFVPDEQVGAGMLTSALPAVKELSAMQ